MFLFSLFYLREAFVLRVVFSFGRCFLLEEEEGRFVFRWVFVFV